jgi:rfaE bifunctional protein nucleotidyltransferase chain/domain
VSTDDDVPPYTELLDAVAALERRQLSRWGSELAAALSGGARLLIAGNGGSAAQAQHLSAELVGRFGTDRRPLSAIALHADTSSMTAIGNDFGFAQVYSRQVAAHGRAGDVLLVLSTSGRSRNLLQAVSQARTMGVRTWAWTGPAPNPLADASDDHLSVDAGTCATQECHLVAIHLLCAAVDEAFARTRASDAALPSALASPVGIAARSPEPLGQTPREPGATVRTGELVILGDLLLDETIEGQVERISAEAPVAVVGSPHRMLRPGGAGLAALLAISDGLDVSLITVHGEGDPGVAQLAAAGVRVINLAADVRPSGSPVVAAAMKTRVRAGGQTLLMLDWAASATAPPPLTLTATQALKGAAAILVSDYGRGLTAAEDVRALLCEMVGRVPVVWDPHPLGSAPVRGVTVATPNHREAAHFAAGGPLRGLSDDTDRARGLARQWGAGHVVITRGRDGVVMAGAENTAPLVVPAPVVVGGDPCGAGDRFAVTLAAALATGATPSMALPQAVRDASAFVAGGGPISADLVLADTPFAAGGRARDAVMLAQQVRARGGRVVATGGCFDLLHRGHVALLEQARQLGDCLIVCVNADASLARLKGDLRPLVNQQDRAAVLEALACVDAVLVFEEDTPGQALTRIRPDIYVKGGDYRIEDLSERVVVEEAGGQVVLLPYLDGRSTSDLIQRAALATTPGGTAGTA